MDKLKTFQLLTTTSAFPFGLRERVIFSLLAYRAKIGLVVSKREIARETTYHRSTVKNAVKKLTQVIQQDRQGLAAIEPSEDWFAPNPKRKGTKHWADRLAARKLVIPKPKSGISIREAAMLSMLESFFKSNDVNFAVARLSSLLNDLDGRTIETGLKHLEAKGLLRVTWNADRFTFGTCWDGADEFFEVRPASIPESQELPTSQPPIPQFQHPETQRRFELLLSMKLPVGMSQEIVHLANEVGMDRTDFDLLAAQKLTFSNEQRASLKQLVDHPGYLIRDGLLKHQELKKQVSSRPSISSRHVSVEFIVEDDYDETHIWKVVQGTPTESRTIFYDIQRHLLQLAERTTSNYQSAIRQAEQWQQQVIGGALKRLEHYKAEVVKAAPDEFLAAVNQELDALGLTPMEIKSLQSSKSPQNAP